ncbi:MAG: globin domain-containing protein [Ekhidna sp.]
MTSKQIDLIIKSWERISHEPQLIQKFYDKLFEIAPETRVYFQGDIAKQSEKFAYTLGFVAGNIERMDKIKKDIEELGRIHSKLLIKEEEYSYLKEALLITIDEALDGGDNTETIQAWDHVLTYISDLMINVSRGDKNKKKTFFSKIFST